MNVPPWIKLSKPLIGKCELECVRPEFEIANENFRLQDYQPAPKPTEIIGPVKVLLSVATPGEYRRRTYGSAFVTFAYFALGASFIITYFYFLSHKRATYMWHGYVYTMGVLLPCAFLNKNCYNGAVLVYPKDIRAKDYNVFRYSTYFCVLAASVIAFFSEFEVFGEHKEKVHYKYWSTFFLSVHGFIGLVAVIMLPAFDCIRFLFYLCDRDVSARYAVLLPMPSFITSTICYLTALVKRDVLLWMPRLIFPFLLLGIIYYNFIAVYDPFRNLIPAKRAKRRYYM